MYGMEGGQWSTIIIMMEAAISDKWVPVKLAEHVVTKEKVAVKIINKQKMHQMNMHGKLSREINIMQLMAHPHVIRMYDLIDTPSEIFMIMEYVSGRQR
ncbi:5-amp-activated protein kinase, putative [Perkinsus marinus ATCC 50983]|uniref:5-amp-activated protein kinase, putative n=1 Tax=Perkinsus marinus (strain ATCC 50983 / TXsc) TaxID=423536 RepID=C5KD16_PERM5|nr:5-amp-activated protein kinase, putative [Perkinsus marinus ATCC 50983]EER17765.1 5-amp-activated protein kinase, putative [Perkinsus marinus ATCC 50983]|eukprot:XP_002785969.1 5-amp-activated protein kinase, putative [Perkinsus marinus ATCC 50983]